MDYIIESAETPKYKRLQTFYSSPIPKKYQLEFSNTPMKFAEAGFVRSPSSKFDEVECNTCGIKYRDWSGESPLAVHRTQSPNCPFINSPPSPDTGSTRTHITSHREHTNNTIRRQLFPDISNSPTFNAADFELPYLPTNGDNLTLFESHRLMTFTNVLSSESAMYAKAGFILNKDIGKVVCVFCNVQIDHNISSHLSQLEREHEDLSPQCPFLLGFDMGNISRDDEAHIRKKVLDQQLSDRRGGKQRKCKYIIKHPEYEEAGTRRGTYVTWPKLHASLFPPEIMVKAGFYYSGFMDKVQCFACGVALYNWSPPADPARQHAKASPCCHFLLTTCGQEFIQAAQAEQLTVDVEVQEVTGQDITSSSTDSLWTSPPSSPAAATSSTSPLSPSASPGSPTLDLEAVKAAMACQYPKYSIERIAHAVRKFFVDSCGRYPNTGLLLGTLKAADENHIRLCEKSQEVVMKDSQLQDTKSQLQDTRSQLQAKDSQLQAKDSQLQAKDSVIQAKDSELQRAAFELQWRGLEMRTELEQEFVGQIQQARQIINEKDQVIVHHREVIEQKDQALEQHREVIEQRDQALEHNAIQLEMKDKEVEDLQRHIRSLMAELDRRRSGLPLSDDDEGSSAASSDTERGSSSMSRSSSSPSDSDSEASTPEEFPVASCKVCLVKPSQIVFLPCKHLCCCERCAARLHGKNCPICREQNLGYEKVYVI